MTIKVALITADSQNLTMIDRESVHLITTSPPYGTFQIRKYSDKEEDIANSESYEEYLEKIKSVMKECFRILQPGRYICWNVSPVLREGQRINVPVHHASILEDVGFLFAENAVWRKSLGASPFLRCGNWLKKNKKPMTYHCVNIYENILIYKKPGEAHFENERYEPYDSPKWLMGDVWELPTETTDFKFSKDGDDTMTHPAPYNLSLPATLIKLFSFENEIIFDPFIGSGTTAIAARDLKRSVIGVDVSSKYIKLAKKRLEWGRQMIDERVEYNSTSIEVRDE